MRRQLPRVCAMPDRLSAFITTTCDETESYRCQQKRPVGLLLQGLKRGSHAFRSSCINSDGGGNEETSYRGKDNGTSEKSVACKRNKPIACRSLYGQFGVEGLLPSPYRYTN